MSITDSLRLLWIGGLADCTGARSWTNDKLFQKSNVTAMPIGMSDISLYFGNAKLSSQYFAHEADRFASASFESLLAEGKCQAYPKSTGWLLIRGYYAAFFAVHSLMRIHGWACTKLTAQHLKGPNDDLSLYYPSSQKLDAGYYLLKSDNGGAAMTCQKLSSTNSHEILWSNLYDYFKDVDTATLSNNNSTDQDLAAAIYQFKTLVDKFGGPKWFSQVRNRVNYSHDYGAWFPYLKSTSDYDRIHSAFSNWSTSPDKALIISGDELIKFASACAFLVSICRTTISDLTFRSKANSPFRKSSGRLKCS